MTIVDDDFILFPVLYDCAEKKSRFVSSDTNCYVLNRTYLVYLPVPFI